MLETTAPKTTAKSDNLPICLTPRRAEVVTFAPPTQTVRARFDAKIGKTKSPAAAVSTAAVSTGAAACAELARLKALFEPLGLCAEQRAFLPTFLQKYETLRRGAGRDGGNGETTPSGKVTICPVHVGGKPLPSHTRHSLAHEWALVDTNDGQVFFDNLYHAYDGFIVDLVVTVKRCHAAHPDAFARLAGHLDCELTHDAQIPGLMVLKARRPNRSRRPDTPQTAITWVDLRAAPTPNVPPKFTACLHLPRRKAQTAEQTTEQTIEQTIKRTIASGRTEGRPR